ncbi:NAD(P)H-binding protein [Pyxidicoccus fallax]|uniref:NAD(P)H-binding protein n=1 Tax=Pyxidicoccus fallax TaxID=394095 RepID=A0A848LC77_9BACT|nr:NAD(P)H-binding protein [Pyxidicoccus fallax]NMO16086.1 NAD(P)H-binding protein [Pyxidicoccus fallax]NPC84149.1 NAD(P)H-binding protein [Pyxidicoccus fallax]
MFVVTGATGNVGRELVRTLAAEGEEVLAVARKAPTEPLPRRVRHVQADLSDPALLEPLVRDAKGFFLLVPGGGEGLAPEALRRLLEAARVPRVVLLSSQGVATRPAAPSHAHLRAFESVLRDSAVRWTFLRPGGFASNALAWAATVRAERSVAAPFADVALPVVDPADIAAVAASALREDGHASKVYELTGPAAISPRQQAAVIAQALGTPLRFVEWSREEARAMMLRFMPEPVADGTLDILGTPTEAERRISPDVERVLGRPARPFSAWVERNLAAFR